MDKDIFIKLLAQREFKAVRSILDVMNEVDIASLLSTLSDKELALAFRLIPKDKAAEVFSNMDTSMQTYLVTMFTEKELKELLDDLYMDDTVDMLEELPANLVKRIIRFISHLITSCLLPYTATRHDAPPIFLICKSRVADGTHVLPVIVSPCKSITV